MLLKTSIFTSKIPIFQMKINHLHLQNFRAYKELSIDFHPNFNIIIGGNGVGKTAILEALTISIGSFFLGIDYAENRSIQNEDIRIVTQDFDINQKFPVKIDTIGEINGEVIEWTRELTGAKTKTTHVNAKNIKEIAKKMQDNIRDGKPDIHLPLLVYYSTERLWKERPDTNPLKNMRLHDGYYNGLKATSNNKFFVKWFEKEEMVLLQQRKETFGLNVVRKAVVECIENCKNIYFDFNRKELVLEFIDKHHPEQTKRMPFKYLSDGVRNMLAMIADIAFRCAVLNPHFQTEAARKTEGIVLIDELDLHLHPAWQRHVVKSLKDTFPNIQFIVTTHSPLILSASQDKVITINEDENGEAKAYYRQHTYGKTANDVLKNIMNTPERINEVQELLDEYFELIENGEGNTDNSKEIGKKLKGYLGQDDTELMRAEMLLSFRELEKIEDENDEESNEDIFPGL